MLFENYSCSCRGVVETAGFSYNALSATAFHEHDSGADLGGHGALSKHALGKVIACLGHRHGVQRLLRRLAEINVDLGNVREDVKAVRLHLKGGKGACEVLVYDGLNAFVAVSVLYNGDSAATNGDNYAALARQALYQIYIINVKKNEVTFFSRSNLKNKYTMDLQDFYNRFHPNDFEKVIGENL